jgi:hypothetical protein
LRKMILKLRASWWTSRWHLLGVSQILTNHSKMSPSVKDLSQTKRRKMVSFLSRLRESKSSTRLIQSNQNPLLIAKLVHRKPRVWDVSTRLFSLKKIWTTISINRSST